jgi:hypothetical protein
MSEELAFEPNLIFDIRNLEDRVTEIERTQRNYLVQTAPVVTVNGWPRADGFTSTQSTSFLNMMRGDQVASAPVLGYDLQWSTLNAAVGFDPPTVAPTSIDWRIRVFSYVTSTYTTLITSNETASGAQEAGFLDLFDLLGEDIYNQLIRIDVDLKQTGGTADITTKPQNPSDIVAVRLNTPFLFRVKSS